MRVGYIFLLLLGATLLGAQDETYADVNRIDGVDDGYKVIAVAIGEDNTKYIGTDKGLIRITPGGIVENVLSGKAVRAVATQSALGIWAALEPNVLYNPETGQSVTVGEEGVLINTMDFSGRKLWVGTNNGVYVVDVDDAEIEEHYTPDNSKLESANVNTIYIEKSRLKWIGTDRGVARVDNKKWKLYEKDRKISAITENMEGVWIASDNEMWLVDPFNRWTPCDIDDGLGSGGVRALAADNKGDIYILSDILVQFDPYNDEAVEIDYEYEAGAGPAVLMVDTEEKLWIGSLESGLLAMNLEESGLSLSAYARVIHPGCPGEDNGQITITAEGGTPPYVFTWDDKLLEGKEVSNLASGDYKVIVEDSDGTLFPLKIELTDPQPLSVEVEEIKSVSVEGASDGELLVKAFGGTGNYSVKWKDGRTGTNRTGLEAGTYTLEVTDERGCTVEAEYTILEGTAAPVVAAEPETQAAPTKPIEAVDTEVLKTLSVSALAVGQTLRIEQLNFPADSSTITADSYAVLDEVSRFLIQNENVFIEIGGHTNGLPEHDYCDRLSTARAQHVAEYLYDKGVPQDRIAYRGYGKRKPVATNSTVAGRRKNQRVEIKILAI